MHVQRARVALLTLLLTGAFALPAVALDLAQVEGDWTVKGTNTKNGAYSGSVKLTRRPDGRVDVSSAINYASGKKSGFSATGTVQGEKIVFAGKTTSGFIGIFGWGATKYKVNGTYTVQGTTIDGTWKTSGENATATEKLTRPPVATLITLVDGNGNDVPHHKKATDGVVLAVNNDDDDNDSPKGDGVVNIVADRDDQNGVANEDDLLPVKLKGAPVGGTSNTWKLEYPSRLAVYKSKDKTGRIASGSTIPAADVTVYVEGQAPSDPSSPDFLQVTLQGGSSVLGTDKARFQVARSAYLLLGHGNSGVWATQSWTDQKKLDKRKNPTLVMGTDEKTGKPAAWAVYVCRDEKGAKFAFTAPGAAIAYDGHSNFGLGYSFETHYKNVREFMNIADPQVPVNWIYLREHQEHPDLMFDDKDYADDKATPTPFDPVQIGRTIKGAHDDYNTIRFPESGGSGPRCQLTRGNVKWMDYHYGSGENIRIVVKAGSRDMPAKKWSKIFLNSCYGGQYYYDSFGGQGTLFFTHDEASSPQTSYIFLRGCVEGKQNEQILKELNAVENINDYHVFGN